MNNKQLFQIRYNQLKSCLQEQSVENMLTLSQAIRQLLIDGSRLIDIVNREYRLSVKFEVGMSTKEREEEMLSIGIPSPNTHFLAMFPPNESRKQLKLNRFLKFHVAKYDSNHFSVSALVKTCANRLGGVHAGESDKDNPEEAKIREFGELLSQLGLHHAFATLILIANITIIALAPISEIIQSET